jgi:4'-phosphopantetheinyl transferase
MAGVTISWPLARQHSPPGGSEIQVWAATVQHNEKNSFADERSLSPDEQERAARFYFDRDRNRFILGRCLLRAILARYLNVDPSRLEFRYGRKGKPYLFRFPGRMDLHFNLAHSNDLVLVAVTKTCDVGVDVEHIRALKDIEAIAVQFFSRFEADNLIGLPSAQKSRAFLNLWTRKEALVKATGDGIGDSLRHVEVTSLLSKPRQQFYRRDGAVADPGWTIHELVPACNFIGAVAVPRQRMHVKCWQWVG